MQVINGPNRPQFIQLFEAIARPTQRLDTYAKKYGDVFVSKLSGFRPFVLFSHPQAIQQILTADPNLFDSGVANQILHPLVGDYSLLLLDGSSHQRQRKLLTPPFHGDRMKSYGTLICEITEQVMSQQPIGEIFSVRSATQEISLRIILRAVFGLDETERFQQLRKLLSSILDAVGSPLSSTLLFVPALQKDLGAWSPWGKFVRQRQAINRLIYDEIETRRTKNNIFGEDILSLMMSAKDENGQSMTDVELRDELMTLLFAGHETTASALAWAFYWIHKLPNVKSKLLAEINNIGTNFDPNVVVKLPYLTAVCQETLRIYPIAMFTFSRILKAPMQIMGYDFASGTQLTPCIYLTHQREDIYPEPKQFKPERFLERQFSPYEFLPFGGSNRRCIGMAFAMFEMKLVLAKVLSQWQMNLAETKPVKPIRRGITLAPSGGIKMRLIANNHVNLD
ncbi:MAG: cytochrome P450 [Tatlockia sp.]|nr:cytochrome P450 [Tatlockia sp.]